jgi:transposase-like protein
MTVKKTEASYSPEVRERAVRMVLEGGGDHPTQWAAINSVAAKIGCVTETVRKWVRQAERDGGGRPGPTTAGRERIKALEREVRGHRSLMAGVEVKPSVSLCGARMGTPAGSWFSPWSA